MNNNLDLINEMLYKSIEINGRETDRVAQAMLYSLKNGGKRVRPLLTLGFCEACGGDIQGALPLACAIEMIHSYSLIHDDLPCMDDDDFRRGKPSCHKAFDYATALLAGDGLLTLAFGTAVKADLPPGALNESVSLLSDCAGYLGMIGGQTMDLQHEGKTIDLDTLKKTDFLKTGCLIKCACVLGCIAAGADEEKKAAAEEYAECVGLAFQIADDVLDIIGNEKLIGKPVGSDEHNEKQTYPALLGIDNSISEINDLTAKAKNALSVFGDRAAWLKDFADKLAVRTY